MTENITDKILPYKYLIIIFLVGAVLFVLFATVLYNQAKENQEYNALVNHTYEKISDVREIEKLMLDMETGQRGYLLTGSKEFLAPYYNSQKKLFEKITAFQDETNDPKLKDYEFEIEEKLKAIDKYLQIQINQIANGKKSITVGDLRASKARMDDVRASINSLTTYAEELLTNRIDFSKHEQRKYFSLLLAGASVSIFILFISILVLMNLIGKSKVIITELDKTRETYRLLLENLNDGIYDYNPIAGTITYSGSYAKMLGYESDELEESVEAMNNLIHPEDFDETWKHVEKYSNKEIPTYSNTFRMQHKNGSWKWILSRGLGTWDENGKISRILGIHTDITDQKQREEELKQLNTDMESFIYIISHDLRAPLVNLKGFTGEIEHSLNDVLPILKPLFPQLTSNEQKVLNEAINTDIPESLEFIKSAVERMDTLTTAILDLSRIGKIEFRNDVVDTNLIAKRCIDTLAYETSTNNIKIVTENLPKIITDPVALEQVIGNILENAVKYSHPGRPGLITISAKQLPWETQFQIKDNGRGIAENDYKKVFDIFRRAGNTGNVRGAGMGMTYVKALLRRLKGRIWFESILNEGTTFYFSIPSKAFNTTEVL